MLGHVLRFPIKIPAIEGEACAAAKGPPFSIYSESQFLSADDQVLILRELFLGLGFGERPLWDAQKD